MAATLPVRQQFVYRYMLVQHRRLHMLSLARLQFLLVVVIFVADYPEFKLDHQPEPACRAHDNR